MNRNRQYKTVQEFYKIKNDSSVLPVQSSNSSLEMSWTKDEELHPSNPKVWGPLLWFSLHNGALKYPENASSIVSEKMKGFIMGIPYILRCDDCSEHARIYIDKHYQKLDEICSGRDKLFCFFVDFHNYVNRRYGKPEMSCEEAKKLYSKKVNMTMSYK